MRNGRGERRARRGLPGIVVALGLLAGAGPLAAQLRPVAESGEITVEAAEIRYDRRSDTLSARGSVVIRRGATTLAADEVEYRRATGIAEARGGVVLTDPQGTVTADAVRLNLEDETGVIEGATITSNLTPYSLHGSRVEKGLGQRFRIENGRFTTCRCPDGPPSWSISGSELAVTLGGYGTLRGGTFEVCNVPVLYVPRAVFPVELERQTGFLMPQFGFSNRRGFQILQPFYWAISRSQDLTLAADVETSARLGAIAEYRYAPRRGTDGTLEVSYFNEFFRGRATGTGFEPEIPENRWSISGAHRQRLGAPLRLYADGLVVSDDLFLREINTYAFAYGREIAVRSLPYTRSAAGGAGSWDRLAARGQAVFYQNLLGPESQVLQQVPAVDLGGQVHVGRWGIVDLGAEGVAYQRGEGTDGLRLDLAPGVVVPLPLGRFAFGAVRGALRETAYYLTDTRVVGPRYADTPAVLPRSASRFLPMVHAGVGTALVRVFGVDVLGVDRLKHTIEPAVEYLFVPAADQGRLPLWDGSDRVEQRSLFTYGLTTRLVGRFADPAPPAADGTMEEEDGGLAAPPQPVAERYRELVRLSVMQSADVLREIQPLQPGRAADHFSDLDVAGRVSPARTLGLRFAANYDVSNNDLTAARVGFYVEDPRPRPARLLDTRTSAGLSYRFISGNQLREINGNAVLRLTDWLGAFYAGRYDAVTSSFLGNYWGLRLVSRCDCWALDLAVNQRTAPAETEVRVQFVLVGLGPSGVRTRVAAAPW